MKKNTRTLRKPFLFFLLILLYQPIFSQSRRTVTGNIVDENHSPLAGVTVQVRGSTITTTTNEDGKYSISVASDTAVLVLTHVGYLSRELTVRDRTVLNLSLSPDPQFMENVVVIGYGTQKQSDVTGAVVSVGAEEIRSRPVVNALQAIQGKAAGVDITSNERPGESGSILIRGVRSLSASNSPLFVVDGIPLNFGGIDAINPNDIESIDILKDASATAIYGSRGANGVVLITTKKGHKGKMQLNYVGTLQIENMHDRTTMMNAAQYIEFRRDAMRRAGTYPGEATQAADEVAFGGDPYALANVLKGWQGGTWNGDLVPTTNWTGMVLQTGITQDQTISVSGGTDKMQAYGSFGYLDQGGTQLGQKYKRYTTKFSVDITPLNWFKMGGTITATYGNQDYGFATTNVTGPGNLYFAAQGMLPFAVPFDENGNRINLPGGDINILNPIGEDQYTENNRRTLRALGSLYAEVNILDGLKYRVNFGPDFYNWRNGRWMDDLSINRGGGEPGATNYAQLNQTSRSTYTLDNLVYFNRTFGGQHDLNVTLLYSSSSYRQETSAMTATDLPWDSQKWYQLNSVSALDAYGTGLTEWQLLSYMARINYGFKDKFLLTASARWDGSSVLAQGNKWDFFPSLAVAWRIDRESFMQQAPWVNQLKVRLGVGSTGNAAVSPYTTKGAIETLYYTWGSDVEAGYVSSDASLRDPISMPNLSLTWEHTTQWNLGIDFGLLRNRISGTIDLYTTKTTDLLLPRQILSVTGYTTTLANIGSTSNRGIDLLLNTVNIKTSDFDWSTTLNVTVTKDKIVTLPNGKVDDINNRWFIGQRLNVYYDYVKDRLWQDTPADLAEMEKFNANGHNFEPGDIKPVDLNGDYMIDANNDRQITGHSQPNWNAGITNTFSYKNWSLAVFIYSRWGFTVATGAESLQGRYAQRLLDYWTPAHPTNDYPSPDYNSAAGDPYKSAMNYQDGSFIKVRNISLSYYALPAVTSRLKISSLRLYAQVMNPGLLYSGIGWIDPDLGGSTFNRGFVFGINAGF